MPTALSALASPSGRRARVGSMPGGIGADTAERPQPLVDGGHLGLVEHRLLALDDVGDLRTGRRRPAFADPDGVDWHARRHPLDPLALRCEQLLPGGRPFRDEDDPGRPMARRPARPRSSPPVASTATGLLFDVPAAPQRWTGRHRRPGWPSIWRYAALGPSARTMTAARARKRQASRIG